MLEPLSAFSVACNILQTIELGAKILITITDLRKSADGVGSEHHELRRTVQNLKNLNTDLQASLPSLANVAEPTAAESQMIKANSECLQLSNEFIEFLDRLKVKNRHAMLELLSKSIKSIWYKEKIANMENALSRARDTLNIAFLLYMNSKQATTTSQNEILRSTTRLEGSILNVVNAVQSSSSHFKDELGELARKLEDTHLDTVQQTISNFATENQDILRQMLERLDSVLTQHTSLQVLADEREVSNTQQKILESLQFPQMQERRNLVHEAHEHTYRWILAPSVHEAQRWDSLTAWLSSSTEVRRIYWIHGKPGCGKSTLMRFLDENLEVIRHMLPWGENCTILQARCFFWNSGNKLQKSSSGLLRSILMQLLERTPDLIPQVVHLRKWRAARSSVTSTVEWTDSELRDALQEYLLLARKSSKVLLLIDGLDEFDGTDEQREELVELLKKFATLEHVKLCISSRPWNIFQDAFQEFPQLRLEDLTTSDIKNYVWTEMHGHRRMQQLFQYEHADSLALITAITEKAAGVFLWVRLVVRELLQCLRDGDGVRMLWEKLEQIPPDMYDYFKRMIDSIPERHRPQASVMLQIALHREDEFESLHPLRLIDLSFIDENGPDFVISKRYNFRSFDVQDCDRLQFRLDSSIRQLKSRCMGMIECQYDPEWVCEWSPKMDHRFYDISGEGPDIFPGEYFGPHLYPQLFKKTDILRTFDLTVDFPHRTCQDFLETPQIQQLLHKYTNGPYDARTFLLNARIAQIITLCNAGIGQRLAAALASYVISTIGLQSCRNTMAAIASTTILQPAIEYIAKTRTFNRSFWYIDVVLESWEEEQSNYFTFTIDFRVTAYIKATLTSQHIESKRGRPILDYVLRPRFLGPPDLNILRMVLDYGANPNEIYETASVWATFLSYVADETIRIGWSDPCVKADFLQAISMLREKGAASIIPKSWLSFPTMYKAYAEEHIRAASPDQLFLYRWLSAKLVSKSIQGWNEPLYLVDDLISTLIRNRLY